MNQPDFGTMSDSELIQWIELHNADNEFDVPDLEWWEVTEDEMSDDEREEGRNQDREECESIADQLWDAL